MIKSRYTASITDKPWWLAGGIPRSNCVAAYQAVMVSDYESSKINLANPGVYDLVNSTYYPTWTSLSGWRFSARAGVALKTGWQPPAGIYCTGIVRFSGDTASEINYLFGGVNASGARFSLLSRRAATDEHGVGFNATNTLTSPRLASGVLCNASGMCYLNGVYEVGTAALLSAIPPRIYIGADNYHATLSTEDLADSSMNGYIQAVAFYDTLLTGSQIAALTNAMNAL